MSEPPNPEVAVFAAALELPAGQRGAYLDQACAGNTDLRRQVEALLRVHDDAGGFFDKLTPVAQAASRESAIPAEKPGDRIGRYKLLQQIGEGGCGVVYMAEQEEPVHRKVALKVIKLGMDTKQVIARFEAERQALALMDHPNIARVLDAGATETGRPFFVMELVRGVKITDYCDKNNLSTRERLNLFIQVCRAIQHAHQKGIIHRDIKPSNILVTLNDGVPLPKVIDFGIAKATQGKLTDQTLFTAFEQFIGTPAYMSPEQAETSAQDVDTRSDIYSLGVLLYELLTGRTPFDSKELLQAGLDEIRRTIREKEPARPSTRLSTMVGADLSAMAKNRSVEAPGLIHLVRGDLDWIVMKALEKDRTRRYETANGLALDVERHLKNEPVVARPPGDLYRFRKLVRRNKLAFAAAALMAAVLLSAAGISTWQAVRASRAEKLAQKRLAESEANAALATQRLADSEAISKFLTEVFQSPDPARDGRTITVAETLSNAAVKLDSELTNQPARRAKLQATLGATYFALGLYPDAILLQTKVRDYHLAASGPENTDTLSAMDNLARSLYEAGHWDEALKMREQVLALRTKVLGPKHPDTLSAMNDLALSYASFHRDEDAVKLLEEVLALRRKVSGPQHPDTLRAVNDLAVAYGSSGRSREAIAILQQTCEIDSGCRTSLATWQIWLGQKTDYEVTRRRMLEETPSTVQASTADRVAKACCLAPSADTAQLAKVVDLARRAVELGKIDPWLPWYKLSLGMSEFRNGQYADACRILPVADQGINKNHEIEGTARLYAAMSLFRLDKPGEARDLFNQSVAQMPPYPEDESKPHVDGMPLSGNVLIWWLAYKEAKALIEGSSDPK